MTEITVKPEPPVVTPPAPPKDRTWPTLCHGAAFAGVLFPSVGAVVGPLVVWLIKRDEDPEVMVHGKEALNFNLSFFIWTAAASLLIFVVIGLLILPVVWVTWLVLTILGTVKASEGTLYRYPFTIRIID